jgi:hypothetical protein
MALGSSFRSSVPALPIAMLQMNLLATICATVA